MIGEPFGTANENGSGGTALVIQLRSRRKELGPDGEPKTAVLTVWRSLLCSDMPKRYFRALKQTTVGRTRFVRLLLLASPSAVL